MLRSLIFPIIFLALSSAANAQSCNCPGVRIIESLDVSFAERLAKLRFVQNGGRESRSGYSNDASELTRQMQEIDRSRGIFLVETAECRLLCYLEKSQDIFDPAMAETSAKAACPACEDLFDTLDLIEARLSLALFNIRVFRDDWFGDVPTDEVSQQFVDAALARDRALVEYDTKWATYLAMGQYKRRLCKKFNAQDYQEPDGSFLGIVSDDDLMDESDGLSDEEFRAQIRANNSDVVTQFIDGILSIPGFVVGNAADDVDDILEDLRLLGVPLPDGLQLSALGECQKWTRLQKKYFDDEVQPAGDALDKAKAALPSATPSKVAEFEKMKHDAQDLQAQRDVALAALIDCNLKECRPKPATTTQFINEPPDEAGNENVGSAEVTQDCTDCAEPSGAKAAEDAAADDLAEITGDGNLPKLIEPLQPEELSTFERPTFSGTFEQSADNAPAATDNPSGTENTGLAQLLAALLGTSSAGRRVPQGACSFKPGDVCDKLGGSEAEECRQRVIGWRIRCEGVSNLKQGTLQSCHDWCDVLAEEAVDAHALQALVFRVIGEYDPLTSASQAAQRKFIQDRAKDTTLELGEMEEAIAKRRIHIYTNSETGEIIQHAGARFEPVAPLTYTGSIEAPPTEMQLERRTILKLRLLDIETDMAAMVAESKKLVGWHTKSVSFWTGNNTVPRTGCTVAEIEPERAKCKAFCSAQPIIEGDFSGPQFLEICRPVSMMGMLNHPFSREWLYPPGHKWREAGFGR